MDRHSFNAEYVRRLAEGDAETERHFVAYFRDLLVIKIRSRLRTRHLVDDAVQETLLRALSAVRKGGVHNPERFGAFVNGVCDNILQEIFRSESRSVPLAEDDTNIADHRLNAGDHLVSEEGKREVRRALSELSEKDRELLRLVFLEEADKSEVCRRFGVDREYLRVLLHRAKQRFRQQLLSRRAVSG